MSSVQYGFIVHRATGLEGIFFFLARISCRLKDTEQDLGS